MRVSRRQTLRALCGSGVASLSGCLSAGWLPARGPNGTEVQDQPELVESGVASMRYAVNLDEGEWGAANIQVQPHRQIHGGLYARDGRLVVLLMLPDEFNEHYLDGETTELWEYKASAVDDDIPKESSFSLNAESDTNWWIVVRNAEGYEVDDVDGSVAGDIFLESV